MMRGMARGLRNVTPVPPPCGCCPGTVPMTVGAHDVIVMPWAAMMSCVLLVPCLEVYAHQRHRQTAVAVAAATADKHKAGKGRAALEANDEGKVEGKAADDEDGEDMGDDAWCDRKWTRPHLTSTQKPRPAPMGTPFLWPRGFLLQVVD